MPITVTVQVPADARTAWRVLADLTTWPSWNPACPAVDVDTPVVGVGTHAKLQLRHPRGRLFWTEITVTELDPGRTIAWQTRALGLRAPTRVVFDPVDAGTAITLTAHSRGPMAFTYRLIFPEKTQGLLWSGALTALAGHLRRDEA